MRSSAIYLCTCFLFFCLNVNAIHRMPMGIPNSYCDDGKTNLNVDWDGSPVNYTCNTQTLNEDRTVKPSLECDDIPPGYMPMHYCMNEEIVYSNPLPTHAGHRPIWPEYGEYTFVPPQRWSHNIEHGAVVMLTHPCADPESVEKLKEIVKGCIWKHIISVSNQVPTDRPLALVTWGCRLTMAYVDKPLVENFIKKRALHGPEGHYSKNGGYNFALIEPASVPVGSTRDDDNLCPT